jgi:DNA replication and repair protein RecF
MAVEAAYSRDGEKSSIVVRQRGRQKEIEIDGRTVVDRKQLVSMVPCIVFCHDDIAFVTGGPEMQRWFVNQTLSLTEPTYIETLRRYNRVLRARNAALRASQHGVLDALDEQLWAAGEPVVSRRKSMAGAFSAILERLFTSVFGGGENLTLQYRSSWREQDGERELGNRRDMDIRMATTTSGPHRDKFVYRLGGALLTDVASTGQLRLVSLILRVAQTQFLTDATGALPILLLDDVLLELDPRRRVRFVQELPEYEQAFFTFLPDEQYARFRGDSSLTYRVQGGILRAEA